jgi:hypothetical protein
MITSVVVSMSAEATTNTARYLRVLHSTEPRHYRDGRSGDNVRRGSCALTLLLLLATSLCVIGLVLGWHFPRVR